MRYSCTICYRFAHPTLQGVLRHIGSVHSYEPNFQVTCGIDGCPRTYVNFRSFQKHISRVHVAKLQDIPPEVEDDERNDSENVNPSRDTADKNTLKRSAALFLLKNKEVGRVSQVALNQLVFDVTSFVQLQLGEARQKVKSVLRNSNIQASDDIIAAVDRCMNTEEVCRPFAGLESEYLQTKYFKEELKMLEPVERRLGKTLRRKKVNGQVKLKLCWDYAYDIPLLESLKNLLSNEHLLDEVLRGHSRSDDLIGDFCDSNSFKSHPLFSIDPTALQLFVFYDDLEVTNPLGSYTKVHKLAVFYYLLGNLSPMYRSSLSNIQLLTLVKTVDVERYGVDTILEPFMESIKELEKDEGVDFVLGDTYNFRGSLALVCADNLASQSIGGYKALNSALRKCRYCLAVKETMSSKFVATAFQARTRETHKEHCTMLNGPLHDHAATTYGLTRDSELNSLRYFHVTEGLAPDCMHDMLEGTLQYEVKELLKSLTQRRILSLEDINTRISLFPYCPCDAVDKPSPIALKSSDHSLRQTGNFSLLMPTNMWCLARLLPLIIGDCVPVDDPNWENFLLLLKITDYVFSPVTSHSIASFLTTLIDDYLTSFTDLYPECPVIPKQHYMVHIPQWMLRCGPLTRYWCMRFEAKNSHFKDLTHRINNFKNIPKSLARRHQAMSCYLNSTSGKKDFLTGPVKEIPADSEVIPYVSTAIPQIAEAGVVHRTSWIKISGTSYKSGNIVALSSNLLPIFGKIVDVLIVNASEYFFVCEVLETVSFNTHYNAFEVNEQPPPKELVVCKQSDFVDYHVLGMYKISNVTFVPLKYYIPEDI